MSDIIPFLKTVTRKQFYCPLFLDSIKWSLINSITQTNIYKDCDMVLTF